MTRRPALLLLLAGIALAVAACEPDTPPSPTPGQLAARVYTINAQQDVVGPYKQTQDMTVNDTVLSDQYKDPAVVAEIDGDGLSDGAITVYGPPKDGVSVLPFASISSEGLIFNDATGAKAFFQSELKRVSKPPSSGGTLKPLAGYTPQNLDDATVLDETEPNLQTHPGPTPRAFLALLRKGRVVCELFASAGNNSAQPSDFLPFVLLQQQLMQTPPQ